MFDNKQKQKTAFSPFSHTFLCLRAHFLLTGGLTFAKLPSQPRIGGIAKWPKASVCKTDIRGFKSHSRLDKVYAIARNSKHKCLILRVFVLYYCNSTL